MVPEDVLGRLSVRGGIVGEVRAAGTWGNCRRHGVRRASGRRGRGGGRRQVPVMVFVTGDLGDRSRGVGLELEGRRLMLGKAEYVAPCLRVLAARLGRGHDGLLASTDFGDGWLLCGGEGARALQSSLTDRVRSSCACSRRHSPPGRQKLSHSSVVCAWCW